MKNILYLLFLLPVLVFAQGSNENYIQTTTYKQPTPLPLNTPTLLEANIGVTYFDGLGRPIQQVAVGQSGLGNNIVTPILYDIYGRQDKDYLPVPISNASMLFVDNSTVIGDPTSYYSTTYGADGAYRFSEKRFESSPLNRVLEQGAPGEDWSLANNHTIKMDYQTNESDEVKFYKAIATYNASSALYDVSLSIGATSHYIHNTLYKSIVKDENWTSDQKHTTEEFKNQEGQVVLKRTYNSIDEVITRHDTYYVYDQYGNLSFVVPPLAEDATNPEILKELCYQYKYDSRNRLAEKKLPGKQWEFIVYDKLDRVVASGPVNAPFGNLINLNKQGWMITKYDGFNRVVLTGWIESNFTADTRFLLQRQIDLPNYYNESRIQRSVINQVNGVSFNYTNIAWPTLDYHILTVNYYDDYDYTGAPSNYIVTLDGINQAFYNNTTQKPKGLPIGSWVRVLENSTDIKAEISYTLYDKKTRPVKTYSTNHLGGFISTEIKLDFIGKTLYTITQHKKEASSNPIQVREDFTYSPQDRLLTHTHKVNGNPTELLAKNEYDDLGQLVKKNVGGTDVSGVGSLQKVDYSYNIRGWLNSINEVAELTPSSVPTDLFAFRINYNLPENTLGGQIESLYNGNISETLWRTDSDNVKRSYGYQYDELNRLLKANYQKGDTATETRSYDEKLHYDKNGNIKRLERNGFIDSDSQGMSYPIDDLIYTYANGNNSNRLIEVRDNSNSIDGFKDGNLNGTDYRYDDYGNMTEDKNKEISKIFYNHLNLPVKIEFSTAGHNQITYLYNAVGVKLGKIVSEESGSIEHKTHYLSGFQYLDEELQFFPTAEGYVSVTNGDKFNYVYNYTDHLGNIRLSYTKDPSDGQLKILEENHYYPFGLKHSNYNIDKVDFDKDENGGIFAVLRPVVRSKYQYRYNSKEFQDELGLNVYDYQARVYDPAAPHFWQIDPKAEEMRRWSPYSYAFDNPMIFTDPDGMKPFTDLFNLKGKKIGTDGVNNGVKMVVTDKKEAKQIEKTQGNIDLNNVSSGVTLPSDTALKESLNVLDRTIKNGGLQEETSLVMKDGTVIQGQTGPVPTIVNNVQTAPSTLPNLPAGTTTADVETTIHSHPTTVQQVGNTIYPQSASTPSTGPGTDQTTFQQFGTNIIVGPLGTVNPNNVTANPNGTLNIPSRPNGAAIYDSNSNLKVELERKAIENILKN